MKTRCPDCQTTFRVTPEQLKARAGKVRCGQCQTVFNALDSLLDEAKTSAPSAPQSTLPLEPAAQVTGDQAAGFVSETPAPEVDSSPAVVLPLSEAAVQELGRATGLIMPRETTGIPGYSKWSEGVMAEPVSLSVDKAARWPFVLAALLLLLALAGQLVFRFRSEIAITMPSLRPVLELLCQTLDVDIPLPRHVELVNIEMSDLQTDPARGNLLVLNASLRNRANYGQAYPSLELSLTDTQDAAIARRVFPPSEYLSAKTPADQPFAANSDITVRLWIDAKGISAAGYRLYVFYP
ncbi:DUF3426 domain-containing protein [Propionivibrio sp.]|uniref:DUF3426 domain-containing protein n=1 Tax=Propionivibrio sp. TaxID=2212460 RepID=UPI00261AC4CF|nr:DUF3426 domain-containing protein [Propionivibrio sp.]